MRSFCILLFLFVLVSCHGQEKSIPDKNSSKKTNNLERAQAVLSNTSIPHCSNELTIDAEIWHNTARSNLIGTPSDVTETGNYEQTKDWGIHGPYPPKKFDLKLTVYNNVRAYPEAYENKTLADWKMDVEMRFIIGQTTDGDYPLNGKEMESIKLISDRLIKDTDFKGKELSIELWKKDIDFGMFYDKYETSDTHLNQVVFYITFKKAGNLCQYRHVAIILQGGE